jgi:Trk K+ transport system NAD-binding subunit
MRIAVIGKSAFGADVFRKLIEEGHNVVVACTELDKNGRADLLGESKFGNIIIISFV